MDALLGPCGTLTDREGLIAVLRCNRGVREVGAREPAAAALGIDREALDLLLHLGDAGRERAHLTLERCDGSGCGVGLQRAGLLLGGLLLLRVGCQPVAQRRDLIAVVGDFRKPVTPNLAPAIARTSATIATVQSPADPRFCLGGAVGAGVASATTGAPHSRQNVPHERGRCKLSRKRRHKLASARTTGVIPIG